MSTFRSVTVSRDILLTTELSKVRFIRRVSAVSNAIETIDNEMICFIIFCLNCIRHGRNATYELGLILFLKPWKLTRFMSFDLKCSNLLLTFKIHTMYTFTIHDLS